jgi:hypothetical protein
MAFYMITATHEPEQCLDALDEILAKGTGSQDKFVFGCKEGDHTGYAIVDAENRSAALNVLPDMMQKPRASLRLTGSHPRT